MYAFTTYSTFLIVLGVPENYLKKLNTEKSLTFSSAYKTSLDKSSFPNSLWLHFKQINRTKNKVDEQTSKLLGWIQVSDDKATFIPLHLVFLKLDTHHCQLDFKFLDENNNPIATETFYLQLLNYDSEYTR